MNKTKKLLLSILLLSAVILFTLAISMHHSVAEDSFKLSIAYSSNVEGYVEPCG